MKKQTFVSDKITIDEIEKWNKGDIVFIKAGTGRGKTNWAKTTLLDYACKKNKRILFLTNRKSTKEKELQGIENNKYITVMTYQLLAEEIIKEIDRLSNYDYVICDEAHYFTSDAVFNTKTDIVFRKIVLNIKNYILVMTSATVDQIKLLMQDTKEYENNYYFGEIDYLKQFQNLRGNFHNYDIENNYDRIIIKFYKNTKAIEQVIHKLKGKVLYFCDDTDTAVEMMKGLTNSTLVCADGNKNENLSNESERKNMIENEKFNVKYLFTTKLLDNGINIKDEELKNIIIEECDPVEIVQMAGRKRFNFNNPKDTVTIYVKIPSRRKAKALYEEFEKAKIPVDILINEGKEKFLDWQFKSNNKYIRNNLIYTDKNGEWQVNELMYIRKKWLSVLGKEIGIYDIKNHPGEEKIIKMSMGINYRIKNIGVYDEKKFMDLIYFWFDKFFGKKKPYDIVDAIEDKDLLEIYLGKIKNKKMFKVEREQFKRYINDNLLKAIKGSHKSLGYNTINSRFEELKINYRIISDKENSRQSKNWKKTYWMIKSFENYENE